MQEAYRPPRSKCSLCCSVSRPGGGVPIQSWTGGYAIQSGGMRYPSQVWMGVPPPPGPGMGYPPSAGKVPPIGPGMEYPPPRHLEWGTPSLPGPGMGYHPPHLDLGWGTPPTWTWNVVHPPPTPKVGQAHTYENITSPHTSYAGGNYWRVLWLFQQPFVHTFLQYNRVFIELCKADSGANKGFLWKKQTKKSKMIAASVNNLRSLVIYCGCLPN